MCATCGCSGTNAPELTGGAKGQHDHADDHHHDHEHHHGYVHALDHGHGHLFDNGHRYTHDHPLEHQHADGTVHSHPHEQGHVHPHPHEAVGGDRTTARTIALEREILEKNRLLAERNRGWFAGREIFAVNLMSSPGSGKTTLLERTIRDLKGRLEVCVVEGDQDTRLDAERIQATRAPVVQINTGTGCHLDAQMLGRALEDLAPPVGSVLFIENVGNLVCPALFDLGEGARVVVASVTEGEDKPLKYPHMFRAAGLVLINKLDLLPHVAFDVQRFAAAVLQVNPHARVVQISATRGDGLDAWYGWLESSRPGRGVSAAWQTGPTSRGT